MLSSIIQKLADKQQQFSTFADQLRRPIADLKDEFGHLEWQEDNVAEFLQKVETVFDTVLSIKI